MGRGVSNDFIKEVMPVRRRVAPAIPLVALIMLLPSAPRAAEWYETIRIGGDLRCRGELIKLEIRDQDTRARIRARLRVTGEVSESWSVGLGLATGTDDPVSANTTLTGGFSRKGIMLDLAYIDFHPAALAGFRATAGKMDLPFETAEKTELMWDNDLKPEGLAFAYRRGGGAGAGIFMNGGLFNIRDTDPDNLGEAWMIGGQAGLDAELPGDAGLMIAAGYFNYEGAIGRYGFYRANEFYGNTTRLWEGTTEIGGYSYYYRGYANDFNIFEALGVFDFALREWADMAVYGDYVNNTSADDRNVGWLAGGSASRGRDRGAVKLYANYRRLEADAVIGAFTDSDFIGGGTDGKGWEIGCAVGAAKGVDVRATYFRDVKNIAERSYETGYERFQLDVLAKF
jgi:hypothetical protein